MRGSFHSFWWTRQAGAEPRSFLEHSWSGAAFIVSLMQDIHSEQFPSRCILHKHYLWRYIHHLTDLGAYSSIREQKVHVPLTYAGGPSSHIASPRIASHRIALPIEAGNLNTAKFKTLAALQLGPTCQLPPSPTCSLSGAEAVGAEAVAGDKDPEEAAAAAPNLVARLMMRRSRAPTPTRPCRG